MVKAWTALDVDVNFLWAFKLFIERKLG